MYVYVFPVLVNGPHFCNITISAILHRLSKPVAKLLQKPQTQMFSKLSPTALIGINLIGIVLYYWANYSNTTDYHDLSKSSAFKRIIECSDLIDGNNCFQDNKMNLLGEIGFNSKLANQQFNDCINMIGMQNDINLMLSIQKCYHQSNLIDNMGIGETTLNKLSIILSLAIQIFVCVYLIINHLVKHQQHQLESFKIKTIIHELDELNQRNQSLEQNLKQLKISINSDYKNLQGRLNKGGDVKTDMEGFKQNLILLNGEFNQFKIDFFTRIGKEFMIIPPKNGLPISPYQNLSYSAFPTNLAQYCATTKTFSPHKKSEFNNVKCNNETLHKETKSGGKPRFTKTPSNIEGTTHNHQTYEEDPENKADDKENYDNFDITTQNGRDQLKTFLTGKLKYNEIRKLDNNNQPYKRVYIPSRGWVLMKKFEAEEMKYGVNEFIRSPTEQDN